MKKENEQDSRTRKKNPPMKGLLRPKPGYIRPHFWSLGFGISLNPAAAGWDSELFARKSLISAIIADGCRCLLG
jgi:hypothetical protein